MTEPSSYEPDFIESLRHIFEDLIPFNRVIGFTIGELRPDKAEAHLVMKPELIGHIGHQRLHGGVISSALDSIAGLAVLAAVGMRHKDEPPAERVARYAKLGTIDLRVDYLRPAIGDRFTCTAEVLRLGSRVASARMEFRGASGVLMASGSAAYIVS